ncbi:MAG: DNA/RNA nuclease SfsA [Asticcacaulis sp.]|uniref:DNA/RNA nuclease SfsA n=1 Tax=Asticcacaulis sp. TaxID=1872648 RepID=UPI003F7C42F7
MNQLIAFDALIQGRLIARYKRFFADIELPDGARITAHCPNPGKMLGLLTPGAPALVTRLPGSKRKLGYRLEALRAEAAFGAPWVGVNTQWPNRMIAHAIEAGLIPPLSGYAHLRPEVAYGAGSRIDLLASGHADLPDAYIEVKNVHLSRQPGLAEFPDCVTARGAKHLSELAQMADAGHRAVVVFCIQRDDVAAFDIARDCDPAFSRAFDAARLAGVEFLALSFQVSPAGIAFARGVSVA